VHYDRSLDGQSLSSLQLVEQVLGQPEEELQVLEGQLVLVLVLLILLLPRADLQMY
jgi:hypothetical protein